MEHKHPHGVEDLEPHPERIWCCGECEGTFADEEIRRDLANGKWDHTCKQNPRARKEWQCESHLDPYLPELEEAGG